MNKIEKKAQVMSEHLVDGDRMGFKLSFETSSGSYIRTSVPEGCFSERVLPPKTVTESDSKIQKDIETDTFVYVEDIEVDAVAAQVGFRAEDEPVFVDGSRYAIKIGKIETETTKKPQIELMVAKDIIKMLNKNNVEAIARIQDTAFLKICNAVVTTTAAQAKFVNSAGVYSRVDLANTMNVISDQELIPDKWLMSNSAWITMMASPLASIDSLAGVVFQDGLPKKMLMGLPVETSVKKGLFTDASDATENYIYLFTAPEYLGKIIKIGTDTMWSKWEKDIFHWSSWRYVGMGFGDTRGIARLSDKES